MGCRSLPFLCFFFSQNCNTFETGFYQKCLDDAVPSVLFRRTEIGIVVVGWRLVYLWQPYVTQQSRTVLARYAGLLLFSRFDHLLFSLTVALTFLAQDYAMLVATIAVWLLSPSTTSNDVSHLKRQLTTLNVSTLYMYTHCIHTGCRRRSNDYYANSIWCRPSHQSRTGRRQDYRCWVQLHFATLLRLRHYVCQIFDRAVPVADSGVEIYSLDDYWCYRYVAFLIRKSSSRQAWRERVCTNRAEGSTEDVFYLLPPSSRINLHLHLFCCYTRPVFARPSFCGMVLTICQSLCGFIPCW